MSVTISEGWVSGTLPGPGGKEYPVKRFAQGPYYSLAQPKPNLVLHTTETQGYIEHLEYPSQWQVGEGFIGQHRPLWAKGEALRGDTTNDPYAMQIEIVGYSKLDVWLPGPLSLQPLVALVAFLHTRGLIKTGMKRPTEQWPDRLDRGPQAVESYYRRNAGLWPDTPGVYGHVDIPHNSHWDPGSFDYPKFFQIVADVTNPGDSEDMGFAEFKEGWRKHRAGDPRPGDAGDPDVIFGWNAREEATSQPVPGTPGPHAHNLDLPAVMTRTDVA